MTKGWGELGVRGWADTLSLASAPAIFTLTVARALMKMQSRTRAIDRIYKRRDRYEIPEWQRQEVWSRSKKQNLIDTILRRSCKPTSWGCSSETFSS
jgi:hypothetical protein